MATLRIKELAQERGFNQSSLQIESRLNPSTVHKYWNNKVRHVSLDALQSIARALQVEVSDLINNNAESEEVTHE